VKKICVLVNAETRWVFESRAKAAEDAKLGVRYASTNFTVGTTVSPLQWLGAPSNLWVPSAVWMAGKAGPITAGVQFKSAGMNYLMLVNL
jgi:hypothetical protein